MNQQLLADMFYASPELWYGVAVLFVILASLASFGVLQVFRLRRKLYFTRRDKDRYAETLYASKDGYFAFIYPLFGYLLSSYFI